MYFTLTCAMCEEILGKLEAVASEKNPLVGLARIFIPYRMAPVFHQHPCFCWLRRFRSVRGVWQEELVP